jgi:hypothetical protein
MTGADALDYVLRCAATVDAVYVRANSLNARETYTYICHQKSCASFSAINLDFESLQYHRSHCWRHLLPLPVHLGSLVVP